MADPKDRISELQAEIESLKSGLAKAQERTRDLEDTRQAMLYMLEDLNETSASVARGKREWEATFDGISDPIFIHDQEFLVVRANRAYAAAAGASFTEIVGQPYYQVFPKLDQPLGMCVKALEQHEEAMEEISLPENQKTYRVRFYPIKDAEGNFLHSMHIMEDITEAKRALDKERILYDLSRKITSRLDIHYRLREICQAVIRLGYKMAWIGILKEDTREVLPKAQAGFGEDYLSAIKVKYDDSPLGQGPTGRAIKTRKPEVQDHIRTDTRFAPWREAALQRGYRSSAAFPMVEEDEVLGVLNVYNTGEEFPEQDIAFLQAFANRSATYLRNARLFDEVKKSGESMRQEMEINTHLLMIAEATTHTTDMDRLMERIVHCITKIMKCDVCLSYLWDRDTKAFQPSQSQGLSHELIPLYRTEPLSQEVAWVRRVLAGEGQTVIEYDQSLSQDPALQWIPDMKTLVVTPFVGKEGRLGLALCIYQGADPPRFTARDRTILDGISHQVSIALEEARLYKDSLDKTMALSHKIETLQVIHEIDRSILSTLEPGEILETTSRMVAKVIPCDRATIVLVDKEKRGLTYAAGFGIASLPKGTWAPFEETSASEVVKTGRPQYVANLEEAPEPPLPVEMKLLDEGFLCHLRVPLSVKGEVIGTLNIGAKRPSAFTHDNLSTLEKLAGQVSVALENARLLSDLQDLFLGTVKALSEAIDAKSPWTRGHSDRVTEYAIATAKEMGMAEKELEDLRIAGLLHDIGKIGTYDIILEKPGRLTDKEYAIMKKHPGRGAELLAPIKQLSHILPWIRGHHEWWDGTGYPDGLKGEILPLQARILAVADTYDSMTAQRPYRETPGKERAIEELKQYSSTQFDPKAVKAFLRVLERE